MIARFVTLLPQPDSPTSPSVSPRATSKSIPLTAKTAPSWVRKRTTSLRTERSGSGTPPGEALVRSAVAEPAPVWVVIA